MARKKLMMIIIIQLDILLRTIVNKTQHKKCFISTQCFYLETAFRTVLSHNEDIWRFNACANERVDVVMPHITHLKKKTKT